MMEYLNLEQTQTLLLELMKEIDRVCKKNDIEYFADSGTLLGAVRHQGFIPWDDDVDYVIKESEVEKLINAMKSDLDEKYELVLPTEYKNGLFYDPDMRIIVKGQYLSPVTEETAAYDNKVICPAADFFVLHATGCSRILHKMRIILVKVIYGLLLGHRYQLDKNKYGKIWVLVNSLAIFGKLFSKKNLLSAFYYLLNLKFGSGKFYYSFKTIMTFHKVYNMDWYSKVEYLDFEDMKVPIPKGYHGILSTIYGNDYMIPKKFDFGGAEFEHIGNFNGKIQ